MGSKFLSPLTHGVLICQFANISCNSDSLDNRMQRNSNDLLGSFRNNATTQNLEAVTVTAATELRSVRMFPNTHPTITKPPALGLVEAIKTSSTSERLKKIYDQLAQKNTHQNVSLLALLQEEPGNDWDMSHLEKVNCGQFLATVKETFTEAQNLLATSIDKIGTLDANALKMEIESTAAPQIQGSIDLKITTNTPPWAISIFYTSKPDPTKLSGFINIGANLETQQFATEVGLSLFWRGGFEPKTAQDQVSSTPLPSTIPQSSGQGSSLGLKYGLLYDGKTHEFIQNLRVDTKSDNIDGAMDLNLRLKNSPQPVLNMAAIITAQIDGKKFDIDGAMTIQRLSDTELSIAYTERKKGVFSYKLEHDSSGRFCRILKAL